MFVERRWHSATDEHRYLYDHETVPVVMPGLDQYVPFSNTERPINIWIIDR